jgi:SAM-dependent methyltransferase
MSDHQLKTYAKLCTEFYDLEPHHNAAQAHAFYQERAREAHGPILEPMCGTGRFLIPLLQAGLDAEGFDASPHMLSAFRAKCLAVGLSTPPIWQQFVQGFTTSKRYALIFIPYGSWGLITDAGQAYKGLEALYGALAPGGRFFVEIETVASCPQPTGVWRRGVHTRADGSHLAVNTYTAYDPTTQLFKARCRYESIVNGAIVETETEDFEQYLYRFDEMDKLLSSVGFADIKKYQDYNSTPAIAQNIHTIIYLCTKE